MNFTIYILTVHSFCFQCADSVVWATGQASCHL